MLMLIKVLYQEHACDTYISVVYQEHAQHLYISVNIGEYNNTYNNNTIYNTIKNNYLTISYNTYVKFNLLRIITLLYTYDISLYISSLKCTTYLRAQKFSPPFYKRLIRVSVQNRSKIFLIVKIIVAIAQSLFLSLFFTPLLTIG